MKIFNRDFGECMAVVLFVGVLTGLLVYMSRYQQERKDMIFIKPLQERIKVYEQKEKQRQDMVKELVFYNKSTPLYAGYITDIIQHYSQQREISPALVFAVVVAESGGDVNAKSNKGAKGLMQIMPLTAKEMGCAGDLFNPEKNISCGTLILKRYIDIYGKEDGILSYLCGGKNHGCKKSFKSQAYLSAILRMEKEAI